MKKKIIAVLFGAGLLCGVLPVVTLAGGSFFIDDVTSYVGIGNTTPAARLDVSGAMYSRLVIATSSAINWNAGNVQSLTLSSNPTLTFSNGQAGGKYDLILTQDSTGGRTVTWPASVEWQDGISPTLTGNASSTDLVSFLYDGSKYLGIPTYNYRSTPAESIAFKGTADGSGTGITVTKTFDLSDAGSHVTLLVIECDTSNLLTGITWDGVAMSQIGTTAVTPDCAGQSVWGLTGAHAVNGDMVISSSASQGALVGLAWYSGTSSSLPDANVDWNHSTGTSWSQAITTNNDNSWVVMLGQQQGGTASAGANTTIRETAIGTIGDSNGPVHPAGSYTTNMNTTSSGTNYWSVVSIAPAL